MVHLPTICKLISNSLPLLGWGRAIQYFCSKLVNYGSAHLSDDQGNGVWSDPETVHQGMVVIASGQMTECDRQLQTRFKDLLVPCVFFLIRSQRHCNSSWNMAGSILMKLRKPATSSSWSSTMSFSYWPYNGRLCSQFLTQTTLFLLLLLLAATATLI